MWAIPSTEQPAAGSGVSIGSPLTNLLDGHLLSWQPVCLFPIRYVSKKGIST